MRSVVVTQRGRAARRERARWVHPDLAQICANRRCGVSIAAGARSLRVDLPQRPVRHFCAVCGPKLANGVRLHVQ